MLLRAVLATFLLCFVTDALARDPDGRYAQSPNREWFDSLKGGHGVSCCSNADGLRLDDPDWEYNGSEYRVKLDGDWLSVPPDALVTATNRVGYAIVWPWKDYQGKTQIHC